ncbi:uncharacterized protein [Triticum aestivum]|nr:uncharacterized protein LOC123191159 isoform X2 [Triticum aestivum]
MPRFMSGAPRSCPQTAPLPHPRFLSNLHRRRSPPPTGDIVSPSPAPSPPPADLPPHLVHPTMETSFSTDPPTLPRPPMDGWMDGAHQFRRRRRRIRTHLRDGGRPHRDPPPALGLVRHTGPHLRLLLRWPSTTAHLRRDLDAQGMHPWLVTSCAAIARGWLAGSTDVRGAGVCSLTSQLVRMGGGCPHGSGVSDLGIHKEERRQLHTQPWGSSNS